MDRISAVGSTVLPLHHISGIGIVCPPHGGISANMTTVTAIENGDPLKLRHRMVEKAINVYKRFTTQLELKIDSGSPWTEIPQINPAHKNPETNWRKQVLDAASNE